MEPLYSSKLSNCIHNHKPNGRHEIFVPQDIESNDECKKLFDIKKEGRYYLLTLKADFIDTPIDEGGLDWIRVTESFSLVWVMDSIIPFSNTIRYALAPYRGVHGHTPSALIKLRDALFLSSYDFTVHETICELTPPRNNIKYCFESELLSLAPDLVPELCVNHS